MKHAGWRRALENLVDGQLAGGEVRRVNAHLAECASCRREHAELEKLVGALRDLSTVASPEGLADQIVGRVRAGEAEPSWAARTFGRLGAGLDGPWGAPLATAGLGLVALVVVQSVQVEIRLPGAGEGPVPAPGLRAGLTAEPTPDRVLPDVPPTRTTAGALLAARHRSELAPGAASVPRAVAASVPRAVAASVPRAVAAPASRATCLKRPQLAECRHLHAWLVGLALYDTSAFLAEIDAVPRPVRERWLGELTLFAQSSGSAPVLAERLRATSDPRASRLAPRFERTAAYAGP